MFCRHGAPPPKSRRSLFSSAEVTAANEESCWWWLASVLMWSEPTPCASHMQGPSLQLITRECRLASCWFSASRRKMHKTTNIRHWIMNKNHQWCHRPSGRVRSGLSISLSSGLSSGLTPAKEHQTAAAHSERCSSDSKKSKRSIKIFKGIRTWLHSKRLDSGAQSAFDKNVKKWTTGL